jgi:hypothetical protein
VNPTGTAYPIVTVFDQDNLKLGWDLNVIREDPAKMQALSRAVGFEDISMEAVADSPVPVEVAVYQQDEHAHTGAVSNPKKQFVTVNELTDQPMTHQLSGVMDEHHLYKYNLYLRNRLSYTPICDWNATAHSVGEVAHPGEGWSNSTVYFNGKNNDLRNHRVSRLAMRLKPASATEMDLIFRPPAGLTMDTEMTLQFFKLQQGEPSQSNMQASKFAERLDLSAFGPVGPKTPEELQNVLQSQYRNLVVAQTDFTFSIYADQLLTPVDDHTGDIEESSDVDLVTGESVRSLDSKAVPLKHRLRVSNYVSGGFFEEGYQYAVRTRLSNPYTEQKMPDWTEKLWSELSPLAEGSGYLLVKP